jgi:hypothetical protein
LKKRKSPVWRLGGTEVLGPGYRRGRARSSALLSRRNVLAGCAAFGASAISAPSVAAQGANAIQVGLTPVFLTSDLELLGNLRAYLARA